jgi:hypothetical protein
MNEPMKTKNLDECDEIKFLFAAAGYRCKLPLSKTSPFADISFRVVFLLPVHPA